MNEMLSTVIEWENSFVNDGEKTNLFIFGMHAVVVVLYSRCVIQRWEESGKRKKFMFSVHFMTCIQSVYVPRRPRRIRIRPSETLAQSEIDQYIEYTFPRRASWSCTWGYLRMHTHCTRTLHKSPFDIAADMRCFMVDVGGVVTSNDIILIRPAEQTWIRFDEFGNSSDEMRRTLDLTLDGQYEHQKSRPDIRSNVSRMNFTISSDWLAEDFA